MQSEENGWVLKELWDLEAKEWKSFWTEDERKKVRSRGPHACRLEYLRSKEGIAQLSPLKYHQYYIHLGPLYIWCPSPPEYVSDYGPGLQGLSCFRVHAPDLEDMHSLRYLQLFHPLKAERVLDQVSSLTRLRKLSLINTGLLEVPASWSALEKLEELRIPNIPGLSGLLESLPRLTRLRIDEGSEKELPPTIYSLSSLQALKLCLFSSLKALPPSFGNLYFLQTLDLSGCSHIQALPANIGSLSSLQTLDLSFCDSLKALPSSVGSLSSLRELDLFQCRSLEALPEDLGLLVGLEKLDITDCTSLKGIARSLERLEPSTRAYYDCEYMQSF